MASSLIIPEKVESFHFNYEWLHALCQGLEQQRRNASFCDVILKVCGRELATHSSILAIFSPFFLAQLNSTRSKLCLVTRPEEIELQVANDAVLSANGVNCEGGDDCAKDFDAVKSVIDFCYTGKLDVNIANVSRVLQVAEQLRVEPVTLLCKSFSKGAARNSQPLQDDVPRRRRTNSSAFRSRSPRPQRNCPRRRTKELVNFDVEAEQDSEEAAAVSDIGDGSVEASEPDDDHDFEDDEVNDVEQRGYACRQCSFVSRNPADAQMHKRIHYGKSYVCKTCGFLAVQVSKLLAHLTESCHGETVCSLCNFEAESIDKLQDHLARHDDHKPFFCFTCEQRFKTRTALGLHLPKHSSEKPFVCKVCQRGFKWKHALQSHMIVHSDLKQLLCDQCGYRTAHKSSFKAHRLLHTGETFKCPFPGCNFQAVRKQNLKQHTLTHTKEKPYQCEVCGQAFSLSKNMRRHARMHNADKNEIQCTLCHFTTTRPDKLKEHIRKHHQEGDHHHHHLRSHHTRIYNSASENDRTSLTSPSMSASHQQTQNLHQPLLQEQHTDMNLEQTSQELSLQIVVQDNFPRSQEKINNHHHPSLSSLSVHPIEPPEVAAFVTTLDPVQGSDPGAGVMESCLDPQHMISSESLPPQDQAQIDIVDHGQTLQNHVLQIAEVILPAVYYSTLPHVE